MPSYGSVDVEYAARLATVTALRGRVAVALLVATALGAGCGDAGSASSEGLLASDIPVAHTPPGGYGDDFPPPILAGCTEPLVAGAPDLRGMWRAIAVDVGGEPAPPEHPAHRHFQRVEQCGDRLVVTAGGVIHDMRCDGTVENGVHDVAELDFATPITVVATYEDGVHVLRPVGIPAAARGPGHGVDLPRLHGAARAHRAARGGSTGDVSGRRPAARPRCGVRGGGWHPPPPCRIPGQNP